MGCESFSYSPFSFYYNISFVILLHHLLAVNDVNALRENVEVGAYVYTRGGVDAALEIRLVSSNTADASSSRNNKNVVKEVTLLALDDETNLTLTLQSGLELSPLVVGHREFLLSELAVTLNSDGKLGAVRTVRCSLECQDSIVSLVEVDKRSLYLCLGC